MPLEVQCHSVPHLKALNFGIYKSRGLSCDRTSGIFQGILRSNNLLHKQGFVKTQLLHTVQNDEIEF